MATTQIATPACRLPRYCPSRGRPKPSTMSPYTCPLCPCAKHLSKDEAATPAAGKDSRASTCSATQNAPFRVERFGESGLGQVDARRHDDRSAQRSPQLGRCLAWRDELGDRLAAPGNDNAIVGRPLQ